MYRSRRQSESIGELFESYYRNGFRRRIKHQLQLTIRRSILLQTMSATMTSTAKNFKPSVGILPRRTVGKIAQMVNMQFFIVLAALFTFPTCHIKEFETFLLPAWMTQQRRVIFHALIVHPLFGDQYNECSPVPLSLIDVHANRRQLVTK